MPAIPASDTDQPSNNTVIGVDGDGTNDAEERNVFSGVVPPSLQGYDHNIEFYGQTPGTNVVVAGNYIGIGVDGTTRFTNGVPALNAAGGSAQYRFGSDFDGVSDALEGNVVYNNWPSSLFPASDWDPAGGSVAPDTLSFFDELSVGAAVSARGNVLVGNFPLPVSPLKSDAGEGGAFLKNYLAKALADPANGIDVVLATNSTTSLITGTVPVAGTNYPTVIVDLYTLDPEGSTNGLAANIPELPNGFVQGRAYVGSHVVSATDGTFSFDISGFGLAAGAQVTATANYSPSAPGTHNAPIVTSAFSAPVTLAQGSGGSNPTLMASRSGENLVLAWPASATGFVVQSSGTISPANWQDLSPQPAVVPAGNQNIVTIPLGADIRFYRLRK